MRGCGGTSVSGAKSWMRSKHCCVRKIKRRKKTEKERQRSRSMNAQTKPDAYGRVTGPTTLKIERLLPGPLERIWGYLTDSKLRRKWLAAGTMEMKVGAP